MNFKMMGRFIGQIIAIEALFMLPALGISLYCGDHNAAMGFLYTLIIMVALGAFLLLTCRNADRIFGAREGMVCVGVGWIMLSFLGCLPFWFSKEIPSFINAFFESVSGFTTTGASILSNVEGLTKGMLYWRSFTHWLGGMGVLVFLLAVAPSGGKDKGFTMHLLRAESPGPDVGKLVPKMRQTATILYVIYVVMTIINVIFLVCGEMDLFEALCTAFGCAGTGGFGIKNDSMASYSAYTQYVCTVFVFLFGINFSCYYLLLIGQIRSVFKDEELRLYIGLVILTTLLIAWNVRDMYASLEETLRHSSFQVCTIITTTGFSTVDFDLWPSLSKGLLMLLMVTGACAGSTGGGLKCARALLLLKSLRRNIRQLLNPRKVQVIRVNDRPVTERVLDNVNAYLAGYVAIILISFLIVSADKSNFSIGTNFTAVLACFNNIGPGMEAVGPACNYDGYHILSKMVLIVDMLAGRLEIFPILALFSRSTWTRN